MSLETQVLITVKVHAMHEEHGQKIVTRCKNSSAASLYNVLENTVKTLNKKNNPQSIVIKSDASEKVIDDFKKHVIESKVMQKKLMHVGLSSNSISVVALSEKDLRYYVI